MEIIVLAVIFMASLSLFLLLKQIQDWQEVHVVIAEHRNILYTVRHGCMPYMHLRVYTVFRLPLYELTASMSTEQNGSR